MLLRMHNTFILIAIFLFAVILLIKNKINKHQSVYLKTLLGSVFEDTRIIFVFVNSIDSDNKKYINLIEKKYSDASIVILLKGSELSANLLRVNINSRVKIFNSESEETFNILGIYLFPSILIYEHGKRIKSGF